MVVTQSVLIQLLKADCEITISMKSTLILRDLELLRKFSKLKVAFSINTLDEKFCADMDNANSIKERLIVMKKLHDANIHTVLFLSPIFSYITDCEAILKDTSEFVDEYWFENLNLRSTYKQTILAYIATHYPQYLDVYKVIYLQKNHMYWLE